MYSKNEDGLDESQVDEINRLLELVEMSQHLKQYSPELPAAILLREIGYQLDIAGGIQLMQKTYARVNIKYPWRVISNLNGIWQGVGQWLLP